MKKNHISPFFFFCSIQQQVFKCLLRTSTYTRIQITHAIRVGLRMVDKALQILLQHRLVTTSVKSTHETVYAVTQQNKQNAIMRFVFPEFVRTLVDRWKLTGLRDTENYGDEQKQLQIERDRVIFCLQPILSIDFHKTFPVDRSKF